MRVRSRLQPVPRLPMRGGQDLRGYAAAMRGETGRSSAPLLAEDRMAMAEASRGFGGISDVLAALSSGSITNPEQLISSITLQTAYLPDITMNSPLAPSPDPSSVGPLMAALKPQLTINFANNLLDPMVIAPNGAPPPTAWPTVEAGGILLGLTLLGLSVAGIKYIKNRRKMGGK